LKKPIGLTLYDGLVTEAHANSRHMGSNECIVQEDLDPDRKNSNCKNTAESWSYLGEITNSGCVQHPFSFGLYGGGKCTPLFKSSD
jgi:hypothetical protein